ncbi:hypothetical protein ACFOEK_12250 [Litoribrevibacter euphylliae]|uniref:Holin n=1 Tax=Litoribrevibacter euphylliae TaxID=1834034 RepID=A0ABV7HDD0_9GAMM
MCKAGKAVINRLKEPSTMAGLAIIGTVFGVPAEATTAVVGLVDPIWQAVTAGAAALAVCMPEKTQAK